MTESPLVVLVERLLPAPPDAVYDEWLDPETLREWICPRPARPVRIDIEPRPGGRLRIEAEEHQSTFEITGEYLTLDRPRLLAFTWSCSAWPNPDLITVVTVTLGPHGDARTQMSIRHSRLPQEQRPSHQAGWTLIADQLGKRLSARA
jgi:uncharacterized protein YndB with AHSA1/START domain